MFGCYSDEKKYGPHAQLTGTALTWGNYFTEVVTSVLNGTWKPEDAWGGFKRGFIDLLPLNSSIPSKVQKQVAELKLQMATGRLHPFAGPVLDQDGKVRVPLGQTISDLDLAKMDYYVQGVASRMPSK
jgi:simple sugar transport system substrate-binding protein